MLVGTEAVLYREGELRRSGGVGAVAFLDFDQELLAPRYRAGEEAIALLARASRLLGGRQQAGALLVQTRVPDHPVLQAASLADPGRLTTLEEPVRKSLRLPPFAALAVLSGPGADVLAGLLEKEDSTEGTERQDYRPICWRSPGPDRLVTGPMRSRPGAPSRPGPLGCASAGRCHPGGRPRGGGPPDRARQGGGRPGPLLTQSSGAGRSTSRQGMSASSSRK